MVVLRFQFDRRLPINRDPSSVSRASHVPTKALNFAATVSDGSALSWSSNPDECVAKPILDESLLRSILDQLETDFNVLLWWLALVSIVFRWISAIRLRRTSFPLGSSFDLERRWCIVDGPFQAGFSRPFDRLYSSPPNSIPFWSSRRGSAGSDGFRIVSCWFFSGSTNQKMI